MANNFKRTDRIAETLKRELALIIHQGWDEPHLKNFITLSAVNVSRDLRHAKVYFTVFNEDPVDAELKLNTAAGYFRSLLAKNIALRIMPQLHFVYDQSVEYGQRLSRLIDEVNPDSDNEN
jgi:ribosome-binding factor A